MWRTHDARSYTVPLVLIGIAGLIHAFFDDWLFAVGAYLNVFFWTAVFLLAQLQSGRSQDALVTPGWSGMPVPPRPVPLSTARSAGR